MYSSSFFCCGDLRSLAISASQAKPGITANQAESIAGDLTVAHIQKLAVGKRPKKSGTVTVGEKIKLKLEKRAKTVGRNVENRRREDESASEAVATLLALDGSQLSDFVRLVALFIQGGDPIEWMRVYKSPDPKDRALYFVHQVIRGSSFECDPLRRNQELCEAYGRWAKRANRILSRGNRIAQMKSEQKAATKMKVTALRRRSGSA